MQPSTLAASAPSRNQGEFQRLAEAWRADIDARRGGLFVQYLANFLRSLTSDNTRRTYIYSLLSFWQWMQATYGRLPTPDRVERQHALRYAEWLRTSTYGIDEHRLRADPERRLEAAVYAILRESPGLHIGELRRRLGRHTELVTLGVTERRLTIEVDDPHGLDRFLACLVERTKTLTRSPTVEELRRRDPSLYARLGQRIDPEIFAYACNPHTRAEGVERSSSVATRLAVLSSFWKYLIQQTGENAGPTTALLRHNIWEPVLSEALESVAAQRAIARARKTPDLPLFDRLLATTEGPAFEDVRDRAVLLFLRWVAVRARELGRARRGDIAGQPPILTFVGKGNKPRQVAVPPPAIEALQVLTAKLEELGRAAERASPGTIPRHVRLLDDDAPLFPAIARWGCNAGHEEESGLTRQGIAMMLRRRAVAAGIDPGSADFVRIHPHGLRHLAAQAADEAGVPLNTIQAVLGHKSLATTGVYVERRDPRTVTLHVPTVAPQASPTAPAARPTPVRPAAAPSASTPPSRGATAASRRPVVIDTTAIPVDERADPIEPGERLVAVGPLARRPGAPIGPPDETVGPIEGLRAPVPVADVLNAVYTSSRWGEKDARQALHKRRVDFGDIEARDDLLTTTYAGYTSGLVWWAGPGEKLKPEMPVIAPAQLLDEDGAYGSVRRGLDALWVRWVDDQEKDSSGRRVARGPTAAAALVAWLRQALEVMEQTDVARQARGGAWIPYDATLDLTKTPRGEEVQNFRLQREDMIVFWFSVRAYSYMQARGREGDRVGRVVDDVGTDLRPKDGRIDLAWFDAADPVAELPDDERAELFDWLLVLTGRPPIDKTKRYTRTPGASGLSLSRHELAGLLGLFCAYDDAEDARDEMLRRKRSGGQVSDAAYQRAVRDVADAARAVDLTVQKLRAIPGYSIKDAVAGRSKATSLAQSLSHEAKDKLLAAGHRVPAREMRRAFAMRQLAELFDPKAAEDEYLRLYALCGRAQPLFQKSLPQGGDYAELFRIDPGAKTIVHTSDFQRLFAESTGAHSECVARRMARQLWELKRAGITRLDERGKEIEEQLATWAFYRVPCPASLEGELRTRLKGAPRAPLTRALDAGREAERERLAEASLGTEGRLLRRLGAEDLAAMRAGTGSEASDAEFAEGFQFEQNRRRVYLKNARAMIPSPVTLLCWLRLA